MQVALWIDTPALGDTIAAIPTLRKLSRAYNEPLTVFTSKPFLFENHPLVKQALPSDADKSNYKVYRTFSPLVGKQYLLQDQKVEFRYSNMDLRQFHAVSLGFTLTEAEMEMDLYIETPRELPVKDYVIIHPTHTWPTRTWDQAKWQELIDRLNDQGIPVVAVGRDAKETGFFNTQKPVMDIKIRHGVNLLNDPTNDPAELRWMMNHRARAVVTMDSGMLHIAGTTDVNIIQLGSSIDNKLRAPYRNGSQDYKYTFVGGTCDLFCSSNQKYNVKVHGSIHGVPPQVNCLESKPTFECHPTVDQVFDATTKIQGFKKHFDFIEIGTSDFDALIETASDQTVGISVEPITKYLESLPNKKNVIKVNAAISDHEGTAPIYYIEDYKITEHNLPWWVKGSNSIFKPHPFCVKELGEQFYNELVTVRDVALISIKTLFKNYNVGSVDLLKVDTEGHDHVILRSYLEMCKEDPSLLANRLIFEMHDSVSSPEMADIVKEFKQLGYTGYKIKEEYFMFKHGFETRIPKIIHQTFKSFDALDQNLLESVNQLKEQNPDWEYRFYSDADCVEFIKNNYDTETLELYLSINETYGAARADFFRYLVMYKEGGVYFDIKSGATDRLSNLIHPETEYILTHWPGKDFADELNYELGEFQNWHIITIPGHPFLARTIELVKENLRRLKAENAKLSGKEAVLRTTGPIVYSKAILELLDSFEHTTFTAPVKHYALESEAGLKYIVSSKPHWDSYKSYALETSNLLKDKFERAYITHCDEGYAAIANKMIETVKEFSSIPVVAYVINSDVQLPAADLTIRLDFDIRDGQQFINVDGAIYVNRASQKVFDIITKKPNVIKHALQNVADHVVYLDGDTIATQRVDDLFNYTNELHPMLTQAGEEFMMMGGKGSPFVQQEGQEEIRDLKLTLEAPACKLFGVDLQNRNFYQAYVQTGYISAIKSNIPFIDEWIEMCNHPEVVNNTTYYAPYHEETLVNVLLWKYNYRSRMPLVYVNANSVERIDEAYAVNFNGADVMRHGQWFFTPGKLEDIKVFHGEKRPEVVDLMVQHLKEHYSSKKTKLVFLAPHLSTGGMPEFLLGRLKALINEPSLDIHVVEYCLYAETYTVQRDQIQAMLPERNFHAIGHLGALSNEERETKLIAIISSIKPDVIHIEESPEAFDSFNQMSVECQAWLYQSSKPWKIVETCHNIWFDPKKNKRISPDAYLFVSPHHSQVTFSEEPSEKFEAFYPIIPQTKSESQRRKSLEILGLEHLSSAKHIINIGLWTPGKNQVEALAWARELEGLYPGQYQFHFVGNQAANFQDYWQPAMQNLPPNVHIWGERSDVDTFYQLADAVSFNSTWECNPLALRQALGYPIPVMARNLPQYHSMYTDSITAIQGDSTDPLRLVEILNSPIQRVQDPNAMQNFKQAHLNAYKQLVQKPVNRPAHSRDEYTITWFNGPRVTSQVGRDLHVQFLADGQLVYSHTLQGVGHWCRPSQEWYRDWTVVVDGLEYKLNLQGGRAMIQFDSGSLGDTLSWIEAVVDFRNVHGMDRVYLATHKNWLFDREYYLAQGVELVPPGNMPADSLAYWSVGVHMQDPPGTAWFPNRNKRDWRKIYLGDIITDHLGLASCTRPPKLVYTGQHTQTKPYICIATQSTAQAKYWNNPTGWQELIDHYNAKGYDVYHLSKEGTNLQGVIQAPEAMDEVYKLLKGAQFFVGISSGLSWFAWACDVPVVLISGFTPEECEFQNEKTLRIIDKSVCNSCWAWDHFNRGDWHWCPTGKGTDRHYECTKVLTGERVINLIENWQPNATN